VCKKAIRQKEFRNTAQALSDPLRKTEALLQLKLTMGLKGNKKSTCCYTSTKRLSKKSVDLLLCGARDLTADRLRIGYSMFSLPQSSTARSPRPLCLLKVQGRKVPAADGD